MVDAGGPGWRALVAPGVRGVVAVLTGGVLLFAVDNYLTASLLPSAVAEIGGERFYAWTLTLFLLASVLSATLVSRLLATTTPRRAYLGALALFGTGLVIDALAPSMPVLLVGRVVQGLGGGALAGMAYVLIRWVLPASLWTRASALVSTMWGAGLLVGPALGGALAEIGLWRAAFGVLAVATAAVAVAVPAVLPSGPRRGARPGSLLGLPWVSLVLVGATAGVVSVAGLAARPAVVGGGIALGVVLLGAFVLHERGTARGVLPRSAFRSGSPIRWFLTVNAVLSVAATVETWVPLFGQRLGGLAPLAAGFLGASLSAGWVAGEVTSAGTRRWSTARLVLVGTVTVVVGLALAAVTQQARAGGGTVLVWSAALALAGAGIGTAWPHLAAGVMGGTSQDVGTGTGTGTDSDADGDRASAAITVVQMLATTVGAALTGVAVALGEPDPVTSARLLYGGFAGLSVLGVVAAVALAVVERHAHRTPAAPPR